MKLNQFENCFKRFNLPNALRQIFRNIGHYSPAAKLSVDRYALWRKPEVWPGRGHIRA
jgi:hypothetical protein